jgi:hypothetical protein
MSQTVFRKENRLGKYRQNFKLHTSPLIFVPSKFLGGGVRKETAECSAVKIPMSAVKVPM